MQKACQVSPRLYSELEPPVEALPNALLPIFNIGIKYRKIKMAWQGWKAHIFVILWI
jgi:hypothetical protein